MTPGNALSNFVAASKGPSLMQQDMTYFQYNNFFNGELIPRPPTKMQPRMPEKQSNDLFRMQNRKLTSTLSSFGRSQRAAPFGNRMNVVSAATGVSGPYPVTCKDSKEVPPVVSQVMLQPGTMNLFEGL